jgi:polysaccharide export outer membrane protein
MDRKTPSYLSSKKAVWAFILFWSFVVVGGCATKGPEPTAKVNDLLADQEKNNQEISELNEKLFASVSSAPEPGDYILSQGDLLQITIFEAEELNTEARVSARGFVTLPLLGQVEVKRLTAREAEQKIEDLYRKDYLQNPHVSVFVKEHQGGKITLLGALQSPGTFDYPGRQHLLDVLALAGGLSENAGQMVQVRRKVEDSDRPETFLVDLDALVKEGKSELNIEIRGGDVVFVPEGGVVYVDGAVRKAGTFPIKEGMTVREAIIAAGGLSKIADEKDVKLVRYTTSGKREVVKLNLRKSKPGSSNDLLVQDRDVIFVETNRIEALIYGLRVNLGGLVGIGYSPPQL